MKLQGDLVLEITRNCNMSCEHCLRGEKENLNMPDETIIKTISQYESISTITFTGGEPSLVPAKIMKTIEVCKGLKVLIGGFYIATNTKMVTNEFIRAIMELYLYCDEKEMCCLDYSNDMYHEIDYHNIDLLKAFSFTNSKFIEDNYDYNYEVIPQGMAAINGLACKNYEPNKEIEYEEYEDEIAPDGYVYINVKGDILPDCDLSYDSQEYYKLGNIYDDSIVDVITRGKE